MSPTPKTPTGNHVRKIAMNLRSLSSLSANHVRCLTLYDNGKDLTEDIDKAVEMGTDMILQVLPVLSDLMEECGFLEMLTYMALLIDVPENLAENASAD